MTGIETAAITLSTAVVKSAAKLWLGDRTVAADVAASAIDIISSRATDFIDKRQVNRTFDRMIDTVARKLKPFIESELPGLPSNERTAAVIAAAETFGNAAYADDYLFSTDLNAGYIDAYLRRRTPHMAQDAFLSEAATALYDRLIRESCEYLVQVTLTLPQFPAHALTELLRRDTEIISDLDEILRRLPERPRERDGDSFSVDYRRQIVNQLDRMELFGATLSEARRRYPLTVAYISLNMSAEAARNDDPEDDAGNSDYPQSPVTEVSVDQGLATTKRVLIRGEAGSGKTTLMKWIAVRSALQDFPAQLSSWSKRIPFLIPLRRYVNESLPSLEQFPDSVGRFIAEEMPNGYVLKMLRSGQATVLIDGLDEFPEHRREQVRTWLDGLISAFPEAGYVITSRPAAVASGWLAPEGFEEFELLPMGLSDIRTFIEHWHDAMRADVSDSTVRAEIERFERNLINRIMSRRHLRALAETPLLCALLCALHFDRRGQLPNNRMELYDVALEMLLERRDAEHEVIVDTALSRTEKTLLLQDIAYWLIRNGWSDAADKQVISRIQVKLQSMSQVTASPQTVYRHLLERSGIIREPVSGRVDFVHRTFLEYLAALDALVADDIGLIVEKAHLDHWREVVIMAAGHAYAPKREELLNALVARGDNDNVHRDELYLLAVACLETSPELSHELRQSIRKRVTGLLPPQSFTAAKSLASAGDFVVDLLLESNPRRAREVAATIRAAAEIGTEASLRVITRYRRDPRATVHKEILNAWSRFDIEEYARSVLAHSPLGSSTIYLSNVEVISGLRYLPDLKALHIKGSGSLDLGFLADVPGLQELQVERVSLTNYTALSLATELRILRISGSSIEDLSALSPCGKLEILNVDFTRVADLAPLAEITTLRRLGLNKCPVNDLSPLVALISLQFLCIAGTLVTDLSPISSLTKLETLDVSNTNISALNGLSNMHRLTYLYAHNTPLTSIEDLTGLTGLQRVNLIDTNVSDIGPLAGHVNMEHLRMSRAPVSDIGPLAGHTKIKNLSLNGTKVNEIDALNGCIAMHNLDISGTRVSDLGAAKSFSKLFQLNISGTKISDLTALSSMKFLWRIKARGSRVSDLSALKSARNLRSLDVANCPVRNLGPLANLKLETVFIGNNAVDLDIPDGLKGNVWKLDTSSPDQPVQYVLVWPR